MFAPHPRSHLLHSFPSPPMSYRPNGYYVPNHVPNIAHATPRSFTNDPHRNAFYSEPYYQGQGSRKSYSDARNPLPPVSYYQSYDRHHDHGSPPDAAAHMPSESVPAYRHTYVERAVSSMPSLKRPDLSNMVDNFTLPPTHNPYPTESESGMPPQSTRSDVDSDFWGPASPTPPPPQDLSPASHPLPELPKTRKARREKPKIALAPDQPPTTQGKPRARVYVACVQCRTRKIRCDGAKPTCHNCGRRSAGSNECSYDPVPKRRGPDKTPGARQRMAREARGESVSTSTTTKRRRRDTSATDVTSVSASSSSSAPVACSDISIIRQVSLAPLPDSSEQPSYTPPPEYPPASDYAKSYSPNGGCGCHGLPQCPELLEASAHAEYRRPTGGIPASTYHDAFDLSSIIPPFNSTAGAFASSIYELDEKGNEPQNTDARVLDMGSVPSLNFTRKVWWDSLLSLYHSTEHLSSTLSLSSNSRVSLSSRIAHDLRWVFKTSNYWFSFFHIPSFFANFCDPIRRETMQPSLILSLLAISSFFQSSEVGAGLNGRERALRFRDEAQGALEASFNSGWIDETLAQAAWLLALFEVCAHQRHSSARSTSAMIMLDSIIRSLSLTTVDADDPSTTLFPSGTVPTVDSPRPRHQTVGRTTIWLPDQHLASTMPELAATRPIPDQPVGCSCAAMTLVEHWPSVNDHAPMWGSTPAWNDGWSDAEIRKESCRRLCWSSMILAAGHISYTIAHRSQGLDLFISDPANYALLFSGESVARSPSLLNAYSSKDTIWALHDRAFLLWHGCIRTRNDNRAGDTDKAHFAVKAWLEADTLEESLNRHTCHIERAFIFQAREYIFNTRMCISYEFQRFIPLVTSNVNGLFHRNKAEEWLSHQATVAERFMLGLHTITGNLNNLLARRPFFVFWFMGQISRALSLWQCDNTLIVALDVCKALLPAIDYLTALWPCPGKVNSPI
ncbi:hypothetical protein D9611_008729 [Ephemerocybe angulata]|uniref:Zn(2)-C6 fungal-type domain-containing protein n=1 Tax=Ephemerocybe angulata TaxID=980116 RepID=A0A8H5CBT3_9AGAR|nr:hypothetical protein D9611_008729 [Tulosesus angulatus]